MYVYVCVLYMYTETLLAGWVLKETRNADDVYVYVYIYDCGCVYINI